MEECEGKSYCDQTESEVSSLSQRPVQLQPRKPASKPGVGVRRTKETTLINDEFTEFSQFGSRFMLNQTGEKTKKTNFVEHLQENKNKIFKKVASTCQKHYKKRNNPDQTNTNRQKPKESEVKIPIALPRCKKTVGDENKLVKPVEKSSNDNLEVALISLSDSVSLSIPSINSSGATLRCPGSSYRLNGSSTKSDTDSGFSGDTHVGDLRIKQVLKILISTKTDDFIFRSTFTLTTSWSSCSGKY